MVQQYLVSTYTKRVQYICSTNNHVMNYSIYIMWGIVYAVEQSQPCSTCVRNLQNDITALKLSKRMAVYISHDAVPLRLRDLELLIWFYRYLHSSHDFTQAAVPMVWPWSYQFLGHTAEKFLD